MRGINTEELTRFVHPMDEDLPGDEQTIFWLKPIVGEGSSRLRQKYLEAQKIQMGRKRNKETWNWKLLEEGRKFEWLQKVGKVENFKFPQNLCKEFPRYKEKEQCNAKGYFKVCDNDVDLMSVYRCLRADVVDDVLDAGTEVSEVTEIDKKK